jgi:flagellin-specific chaperone FliS
MSESDEKKAERLVNEALEKLKEAEKALGACQWQKAVEHFGKTGNEKKKVRFSFLIF